MGVLVSHPVLSSVGVCVGRMDRLRACVCVIEIEVS